MSLPNFEYMLPNTIGEACSLISRYRTGARIMAGGTDILVRMKQRSIAPQYVIDLKGIPGLDFIDFDEQDGLRIGALTTLKSIEGSPVVRERFGILAYAAHSVGSVQIRNKGTVGGNICNASPSADMAPALIGLGARLKIVGIDNERVINVEDFFKGPGESVLGDGEVVTEVRVPNMDAYTGAVYLKHSLRKAMDLAIVGVAAVIRLSPDKRKCEDARIVLGAVAPVPMRARRAEGILVGKKVDDNLVERAAQEAFSECSPISDLRGSAEYRREMVKVFTRRAIRGALKIAEAS